MNRGYFKNHERVFQSHYFLRKWRMKRNNKALKIRGFIKSHKRIIQSPLNFNLGLKNYQATACFTKSAASLNKIAD
jgi:hypothetical protein